jgi:hypothetical protein
MTTATVAVMILSVLGCTIMGSFALGDLEDFRPQQCSEGKACNQLMSALTGYNIIATKLSYLNLCHCVGLTNGIEIDDEFHTVASNENQYVTEAAKISYEGKVYFCVTG